MIEFQTMQQQEGEASSDHHVSPSLSFSSYSSETIAEIAARVIEELRRDPHSISGDDTLFQPWENDNNFADQNDAIENDRSFTTAQNDATENDDFEFACVCRDPNTSPVSADDIFYNGQIIPMYPIFDRSLLLDAPAPLNDAVASASPVPNTNPEATTTTRRRLPLRKLMFEEGETGSFSSSNDESVDLEEGTYCVWDPNSVTKERRKSNSTGSGSKRWKLRNLLLRSHSDRKDKQPEPVVFQVPTTKTNKVAANPGYGGVSVERDAKYKTVGTVAKDVGDQTKRKSFLPYRPELVGLFANVNGLGRNLRPF